MRSLRTKITVLTGCAITITMIVAILLSYITIGRLVDKTSNNTLYLACENGEKNIDMYFHGVEQSVKTVSNYAQNDLKNTELSDLTAHVARVNEIFTQTAKHTNGTLTYYYRIDPEVSATEKGFWYVDTLTRGFQPHEVTDITLYDQNDSEHLLWFNRPKESGKPLWLPPYFTDNFDAYVLSYNVPVYKEDTFVGIIGIEIDYHAIDFLVRNITLYEHGHAFVSDADGNIICHPHISTEDIISDKTKTPESFHPDQTYSRYTYGGVEKQAVSLPLQNGMILTVAVPTSELNSDWHLLFREMLLMMLVLLLVFIALTMRFATGITRPLRGLTDAARQMDEGNYDIDLKTNGKDEVGVLTHTFSLLTGHLKNHIQELSDLAYSDALTAVHNKGAFNIRMRELQSDIDSADTPPVFAIAILDCNDLKKINDCYGHENGDTYLRVASSLICKVFSHSPVFRIGGDEFAVLLQNDDFKNRESLLCQMEKKSDAINRNAEQPYEKVSLAIGIATYDSTIDRSVNNVIRRADSLMYENKRTQKESKQ